LCHGGTDKPAQLSSDQSFECNMRALYSPDLYTGVISSWYERAAPLMIEDIAAAEPTGAAHPRRAGNWSVLPSTQSGTK
jgi:hypothetical protein